MLEKCLKPEISHQRFKGALYILSMEKFGFFYSWKYASILMPALVEAQHSDKQSIVDLLKDFSIKCNRTYSDFALYSMPVKPAILPEETLKQLDIVIKEEDTMDVDEDSSTDPYFLKLEKKLCDLVQSGNLHWRHHQMAIGMLLTMLVSQCKPPENVIDMWLDCLLHDDITIRSIALQVCGFF